MQIELNQKLIISVPDAVYDVSIDEYQPGRTAVSPEAPFDPIVLAFLLLLAMGAFVAYIRSS